MDGPTHLSKSCLLRPFMTGFVASLANVQCCWLLRKRLAHLLVLCQKQLKNWIALGLFWNHRQNMLVHGGLDQNHCPLKTNRFCQNCSTGIHSAHDRIVSIGLQRLQGLRFLNQQSAVLFARFPHLQWSLEARFDTKRQVQAAEHCMTL